MAKRPEYRKWTPQERDEIKRLRDHFGLSFGQIGAKMNATADQCRGVYHTPRTRRMTILEACRQAGVCTRTFYAMKQALMDARRPASTEDVLAELMEKRR